MQKDILNTVFNEIEEKIPDEKYIEWVAKKGDLYHKFDRSQDRSEMSKHIQRLALDTIKDLGINPINGFAYALGVKELTLKEERHGFYTRMIDEGRSDSETSVKTWHFPTNPMSNYRTNCLSDNLTQSSKF